MRTMDEFWMCFCSEFDEYFPKKSKGKGLSCTHTRVCAIYPPHVAVSGE